ncbi:MAG: hypothetical protein KKA19_03505 [Candidatus Margulisbacteria bacterium]|nr:hypothetical protein [Candidatus Margulisiibacteriota bacterium]
MVEKNNEDLLHRDTLSLSKYWLEDRVKNISENTTPEQRHKDQEELTWKNKKLEIQKKYGFLNENLSPIILAIEKYNNDIPNREKLLVFILDNLSMLRSEKNYMSTSGSSHDSYMFLKEFTLAYLFCSLRRLEFATFDEFSEVQSFCYENKLTIKDIVKFSDYLIMIKQYTKLKKFSDVRLNLDSQLKHNRKYDPDILEEQSEYFKNEPLEAWKKHREFFQKNTDISREEGLAIAKHFKITKLDLYLNTLEKILTFQQTYPAFKVQHLITISHFFQNNNIDEVLKIAEKIYQTNASFNFKSWSLSYVYMSNEWQEYFKKNLLQDDQLFKMYFSNGNLDKITQLDQWFLQPSIENLNELFKEAQKIKELNPNWNFNMYFFPIIFSINTLDDYKKFITGKWPIEEIIFTLRSRMFKDIDNMTFNALIKVYSDKKDQFLKEYLLFRNKNNPGFYRVALDNLSLIVANTCKLSELQNWDNFIDIAKRLGKLNIINKDCEKIIREPLFRTALMEQKAETDLPLSALLSLALAISRNIPSNYTAQELTEGLNLIISRRRKVFKREILSSSTKCLILAHSKGDTAISLQTSSEDAFNTEALKECIEKSKAALIAEERGKDAVAKGYEQLKKTSGNISFFILGHGNSEGITVGDSSIDVKELFLTLKARALKLKSTSISTNEINEQHRVTLIINACHSYSFYKINLLKLWREDKELKDADILPPACIAASSEDLPSLKINIDGFYNLAKNKTLGSIVTVEDWIRYVEAFNFSSIRQDSNTDSSFFFPDEQFWTNEKDVGEIN